MARGGRLWIGLVLLFLGAVVVGCGKSKDTGGGDLPPDTGAGGGPGGGPGAPQDVLSRLPGGEEFAAGKKVYADQNCARCHKLGETGGGFGMGPPGMKGPPPGGPPGGKGPGGMSGPDLTTVAANAEHTRQWLADHIRNPKSHKPPSRMPAFGPEKISDADLAALADYLASRK